MSTDSLSHPSNLSPLDQLRTARKIIDLESRTLSQLARRLDGAFCRAVELIFQCQGGVIVSGMGKAGLIGQKIVATLASTGTRSHFLHPAEAVHGDLGRIHRSDLVLLLSQSGETEEVLRLLPSLAELAVPVVAITGAPESRLAQAATITIDLGPLEEACRLGLAPSTSTTAMLALGDALALVVSQMRNFGREDFARFHPAGSLGRKLSKVEHHMRSLAECRVACQESTIREVFVSLRVPGRRSGAIMLTDAEGRLAGIFTDSDLAKMFERRGETELDLPIRQAMTARPLCVPFGSKMVDAVTLMARRKISELPVVDGDGRPVGMLDVTDVVGLLPRETPGESGEDGKKGGPQRPPILPYRVFREPQAENQA